MTMLGGKPSKKSNIPKTSTLKKELLCQTKEDYKNLSPQEREELSKQMEAKYKDSIAGLFKGMPGMMGV